MKTYILYHARCPDGFGAAWSFWKKYKDKVEYIPVTHGEPIPEIEKGAKVIISDFSYPRNILEKLKETNPDLFLIDHHISAQKELEGLDYAIFDMNKSGAVLTWEYLFPNEILPKILEYVQDRDLWRFKLPSSKEITNIIMNTDTTFEAWEKLSERLENNFDDIVYEGSLIERLKNRIVRSQCKRVNMINFHGHKIPAVNASIMHSETGHELLEEYPEVPFALMWVQRDDGNFEIGFRSRGDFDVSELARKFGGGGHKAASGCTISDIKLLID